MSNNTPSWLGIYMNLSGEYDEYIDEVVTQIDNAIKENIIAERRANAKSMCDLVDVIFLEGKIPGLAPYRDERWGKTIDGVFYKDYYKNDTA